MQGGDAFGHQLRAAVDQAGLFGAVGQGLAGNFVVVGLVGLTQVGRVGVGDGAVVAHPQQGCAGVETAGKGDADLLAGRKVREDSGHCLR
ncbi:hypothetical protein D3C72_1840970 [compost metagenome]